ncbi:MAG: pyruvate kinase [Sedimentisphaerales bacterium]|nr:pyruvate kinase [Sedimentisphaerales bacterium]
MIKTKIIATLGPASSRTEVIRALSSTDVGVNMFRLNFSHGTLEEHEALLETINDMRGQSTYAIAVMGDLCGPKIRTAKIEPQGQVLQEGEELIIEPSLETGDVYHFGTNYEHFSRDVKIGQRILIDDGQIALQVTNITGNRTHCRVLVGGPLYSHKGINLPDTDISSPAITPRDWQCVDWAIEHELDYLALSFVRTAEEIRKLKEYLRSKSSFIKLVAKIEKPQALDHLEEIIDASDAVLVARGDLGVEMDLAQVPLIQKHITQMCRCLGKPVIVATQMLQSMIDAPTPTRAEVSDVANAIMDFTDAVMLSGETAVGQYPVQTVRTISRIAHYTEKFLDEHDAYRPMITTIEELAVTATLARSVAHIIDELGEAIKLIVTWSETGANARLLSKSRADVPIIAFSSDELACRQMTLHYGVIPICHEMPSDIIQFAKLADTLILQKKWAQVADQIILLPSRGLTPPTTTHAILLHTISDQ